MSDFHDLLTQLATSHDQTIARLEQQGEDLREELSALHVQLNTGAELPDSEISPGAFLSPSFAPEAYHGVGPESVVLCEPRSLTFDSDVQQLGFRVFWGGDRPQIQKVDEGGAAHERGLCEGDVLLSINGTSTFSQPRERLLPLLRVRPLRLDFDSQGSLEPNSNDLQQQPKAEAAPNPQKAEKPPSPRKADLAVAIAITSENDERPLKSSHNDQKQVEAEPDQAETLGFKAFVGNDEFALPDEKAGLENLMRTVLAKEPWLDTPRVRRCLDCLVWCNQLEEPERKGCAYDLVYSRAFTTFGFCVILMHATSVTALADWELAHGDAEVPLLFQTAELAFLSFYVLELVLKFYVHKMFFFINGQSSWNIFDLFLVVVSSFDVAMTYAMAGADTGGNVAFMRIFRLFKIAKVLRTVRVISAFRKLRAMLESFGRSFQPMFWGLLLLIFFLYIFSLVFAQGVSACLIDHCVTGEVEEQMKELFGSMTSIMLSLYMAVTGGNDWVAYYDVLKHMGPSYGLLFLLYTFFFVFALFNIMTGVFVESAMAAALPDRDEIILEERRRLSQQVEDFRSLCQTLDSDNSGYICKKEFMDHMRCPSMVSYMSSLDIELHDIEHFFRAIARGDDDEVDIDAFVEGCMAMKGSATSLDVQKQIFETRVVQKRVDEVFHMIKELQRSNRSK